MKNSKNLPADKKKEKKQSEWKRTAEAIGNSLAEAGKVVGMIAGVCALGALADHLREKREEMEGGGKV